MSVNLSADVVDEAAEETVVIVVTAVTTEDVVRRARKAVPHQESSLLNCKFLIMISLAKSYLTNINTAVVDLDVAVVELAVVMPLLHRSSTLFLLLARASDRNTSNLYRWLGWTVARLVE